VPAGVAYSAAEQDTASWLIALLVSISRGVQRAPKRALKVLRLAGDCKRLWAIVRLIQSPHDDSLLGSAALREVSAAERFRRVLDGSVVLFDSDLRLQYL